MSVISKMVILMVKDCIIKIKDLYIKAHLKIIYIMDMESIYGKINHFIKDNIITDKNMDMENI